MNLAAVDIDKISHDDRVELLALVDKIKKAETPNLLQALAERSGTFFRMSPSRIYFQMFH